MSARTTVSRSGYLRRTASVQRLTDPDQVRSRLTQHASYAAFALAYADPALFRLANFYEAIAGDKSALIMHSSGGLGPSTFTLGDDSALMSALIRLHPGPRQAFLTCGPSQAEHLLKTHNLWRPQTMLRMRIEKEQYRRPETSLPSRRLMPPDATELNQLYALEDEGIRYSGRQIGEGVYYGAFHRGRLVAAAGTHIYSRHEGIAVVGNIFTHPDLRGRGFGTSVTAAVCDTLLPDCGLVVLNVDPANRSARRIYESLGFEEKARLVEATATRRGYGSPLPLMRRTIARWRADAPGSELIEID